MKTTSLSPFVTCLSLAITLGMGVSCARKPDDAKISSEIQSKFNQDSGLASQQLIVQTSDGVVTLAGSVDNDAQRNAAGRQAASVAGVRTVVNNLIVGATSASAAPTSAPANASPLRAAVPPPADKPTSGRSKKSRKNRPSTDSSANDSSADDSSAEQNQSSATNGSEPSASAEPTLDATAPAPQPVADNPPPQAPPPAPSPKQLIIDQGTQLTVRLIDPIDSEKNQTGDTFRATLNAPLTSDGEEAVPAGVELVGHLVDVKSAGKFAGQSVVVLQLDKLSSGGKSYSLETDQYRKEGTSRGKSTAEKVGGGAILGGIIGAIAGGGKGAAIGTAAGAGAGGGVQAAGKSQQIKLPSETVLNFVLQEPITVLQAPSTDANRPKLGD